MNANPRCLWNFLSFFNSFGFILFCKHGFLGVTFLSRLFDLFYLMHSFYFIFFPFLPVYCFYYYFLLVSVIFIWCIIFFFFFCLFTVFIIIIIFLFQLFIYLFFTGLLPFRFIGDDTRGDWLSRPTNQQAARGDRRLILLFGDVIMR